MERLDGMNTSEHVLALTIQDACSRLEILRFQPFRQGQCFWIGCSWVNGNLLPLLRLGGCLSLLGCSGLLLGLLLLPLMVLKSLLFKLVYVLVEC